MNMSDAWVLPLLPAAAFVVLALFGPYLPRKGDWLAILAIPGNKDRISFSFMDSSQTRSNGVQGYTIPHPWNTCDDNRKCLHARLAADRYRTTGYGWHGA